MPGLISLAILYSPLHLLLCCPVSCPTLPQSPHLQAVPPPRQAPAATITRPQHRPGIRILALTSPLNSEDEALRMPSLPHQSPPVAPRPTLPPPWPHRSSTPVRPSLPYSRHAVLHNPARKIPYPIWGFFHKFTSRLPLPRLQPNNAPIAAIPSLVSPFSIPLGWSILGPP